MICKKEIYTYKGWIIPSMFVVETASYPFVRFATKLEVKTSINYLFKRLLDKIKKIATIRNNKSSYDSNNVSRWHCNNKSLSVMDEQIRDKGGIVDQEGGIHSTASSYKDYLKRNDLVIKDWADGSNRKTPALSNRNDIARIVEQALSS